MTKDQLIREILKFVVPIQQSQLKSYSQERLEDYLNHLRALGRRHPTNEFATAHAGQDDSGTN